MDMEHVILTAFLLERNILNITARTKASSGIHRDSHSSHSLPTTLATQVLFPPYNHFLLCDVVAPTRMLVGVFRDCRRQSSRISVP